MSFNLASIKNATLTLEEIRMESDNHTLEITELQGSFSLLIGTLKSEVMQISTAVSSVAVNATLQQGAIDTLAKKVGELSTELVNQNKSIFYSHDRLIMDIAQLNKTETTTFNQYMNTFSTLNASMIRLMTEVSRVQSTERSKLDQLSRDVSGLQTKVNQYGSLTMQYNNTFNNIAAKLNQVGQAGT